MTLQPGKLILAKDYPADADVKAYVAAVEAADEADTPGIGALELDVVKAYDNFILGCKHDGIWDAIKVGCILAGAKTLEGSFIDLKSGTKILTNHNFTDGTYVGNNYTTGDYNRKTGLVGDGSSKYLDSNRNNNADPQNNNHNAAFLSTVQQTMAVIIAAADPATAAGAGGNGLFTSGSTRCRANTASPVLTPYPAPGFLGMSRSASTNYILRHTGQNVTINIASDGLLNQNVLVYRRQSSGSPLYTTSRLAFYSIGEALDLALLDARVSTLISDLGAAIP